jgi:CheY-like chemotaxis protein
MAQPLRVLLIEDDPRDAELIVLALRRDGFEPDWRRVDTKADYLSGLHPGLDVIMSDYSLPEFSGIEALELLKESGLEIPFMLVSGTIGEEMAVEAMKLGASDYLLKDRLVRLGTAVRQMLDQSHRRKQHKQALDALQRTSRMLQTGAGGDSWAGSPRQSCALECRGVSDVWLDGRRSDRKGLSHRAGGKPRGLPRTDRAGRPRRRPDGIAQSAAHENR